MNDIIKELGIDSLEELKIQNKLLDKRNIKKVNESYFKNYNHILLDRRNPIIIKDGKILKRSRVAEYDIGGYYKYF